MKHGNCDGQSSINFFVLLLIRGTTPLMMWFAVIQLKSAGLVVSIKCAMTLCLFLVTASWQMWKHQEIKLVVVKNLSTPSTYWKLSVIGLLQCAAPYILATYSLQYFPPTMLGVFMVTSPWWSAIFERLPFIKLKARMPGTTKIGMVFGIIGIILMVVPVIKESVMCGDALSMNNVTTTNTTTTTAEPVHVDLGTFDLCVPVKDLVAGFFALIFAPMLWGGAAVFWKFHREGTHLLVSSIGQNFIGGALAALFWLAIEKSNTENTHWNEKRLIVGLVFLGIATGWLATLLVQHLYASLGAKSTNQVITTIPFIVFIQDCIFVRDVITIFPWVVAMEILGLLLVTVGVFISNMQLTTNPRNRPRTSRRDSLSEGLLRGYDDGEDVGIVDDFPSTTSGFYTSVSRADVYENEANKMESDYANYEPPPLIMRTEDENNDEEEIIIDDGAIPSLAIGTDTTVAENLNDIASIQHPKT